MFKKIAVLIVALIVVLIGFFWWSDQAPERQRIRHEVITESSWTNLCEFSATLFYDDGTQSPPAVISNWNVKYPDGHTQNHNGVFFIQLSSASCGGKWSITVTPLYTLEKNIDKDFEAFDFSLAIDNGRRAEVWFALDFVSGGWF
jgi:hypothetical protein